MSILYEYLMEQLTIHENPVRSRYAGSYEENEAYEDGWNDAIEFIRKLVKDHERQ